MFAPSLAKRSAMDFPIPREAPVMTAVFPFSSISSSSDLISDTSSGDSHLHLYALDRFRRYLQDVVRNHHHVAAFADLERSGFMFFKTDICAAAGKHPQRFQSRDPLPGIEVIYRCMNAPDGADGSHKAVGSSTGRDPGIEKPAIGVDARGAFRPQAPLVHVVECFCKVRLDSGAHSQLSRLPDLLLSREIEVVDAMPVVRPRNRPHRAL